VSCQQRGCWLVMGLSSVSGPRSVRLFTGTPVTARAVVGVLVNGVLLAGPRPVQRKRSRFPLLARRQPSPLPAEPWKARWPVQENFAESGITSRMI
jgi:hypothetical protein